MKLVSVIFTVTSTPTPIGSGNGGIRRKEFKEDYHGENFENSDFSYRSMSASSLDNVSYDSGIINKNDSQK